MVTSQEYARRQSALAICLGVLVFQNTVESTVRTRYKDVVTCRDIAVDEVKAREATPSNPGVRERC